MSEDLRSVFLQDIQPNFDPIALLGDKRRDRYIARDRLYEELGEYSAQLGIQPDVAYGINAFLKKKFPDPTFDLAPILKFAVSLTQTTEGRNFFKARSFNYISDSPALEPVLYQALENARFLAGIFGMDFFNKKDWSPLKRKTFFKALIPGTDFYLSVKGGSGAGTFSVDFAVGVHKEHNWDNTLGELWRSGFDTELLPNGRRGARVIRTGGGVKHDPAKEIKFEEFKDCFKMSPARALALLVVNCAQVIAPARITALTTKGAQVLSSLPNTPGAYSYSHLFKHMGFVEEENGLWLEKPTDQFAYWLQPGRREKAGYENFQTAWANLKGINGESFPTSLMAA